MVDIVAKQINDVYFKIETSEGIREEISHYFTFFAPKYTFSPAFKQRKWDGKIRLFNKRSNCIYVGLKKQLQELADNSGYEIRFENERTPNNKITKEEVADFFDNYVKPCSKGIQISPHDFQYKALYLAIKHKRLLLLSPTGSGKSLIVYSILRFLQTQKDVKKILCIFPTTSLVEQILSDCRDYASNSTWDTDKKCHKIYQGQAKDSNKQIYFSTWQSIYDQPKEYFEQFNAVIVDEVHGAKADSIKGIMENLKVCPWRIGLTGTLEDTLTSMLVLEGLFGSVYEIETTKNLIDRGILSQIDPHIVMLKYDDSECVKVSQMNYQEEMEYLCTNKKRNIFIKNLALSLNGNTLVLFQFVEKHGIELRDLIELSAKADRKIFFIFGGVGVDIREEIRGIVEKETDAIIVASYGTFSTGINIKNIHNIIFASPYKSKIKVLQSIGRGLRVSSEKERLTLFDICDDLTYKNDPNYTLDHAIIRMELYNKQQFKYKITKLNM